MTDQMSTDQAAGGEQSPTQRVTYILLAVLPLLFGIYGIHNIVAGYTSRGILQLIGTAAMWLFFVLGMFLFFTWFLAFPLGIGLFIWVVVEACTVRVDAAGRVMP